MHGYQFRLQLGKHSNSRTNENAVSVAMTPRGVGVPRELSIKVVVNGPMLFELSPWLGRSSLASLSGDSYISPALNSSGTRVA